MNSLPFLNSQTNLRPADIPRPINGRIRIPSVFHPPAENPVSRKTPYPYPSLPSSKKKRRIQIKTARRRTREQTFVQAPRRRVPAAAGAPDFQRQYGSDINSSPRWKRRAISKTKETSTHMFRNVFRIRSSDSMWVSVRDRECGLVPGVIVAYAAEFT